MVLQSKILRALAERAGKLKKKTSAYKNSCCFGKTSWEVLSAFAQLPQDGPALTRDLKVTKNTDQKKEIGQEEGKKAFLAERPNS